jgi:hypothetical protein
MRHHAGAFFGLPPFLPFLRAAAALASLVAFPPRRPRATAAGFLRATETVEGLEGGVVGIPRLLHLCALRGRPRRHVLWQFSPECFVGAQGLFSGLLGGVQCVRHEVNIPNRLGYVNPHKTGLFLQVCGVSA